LGAFFAGARLVAARLSDLATTFFFAGLAAGFAGFAGFVAFAAGFALTLAAAVALTAVLRPLLRVLAAAEAGLVFAEGLALGAGRFAAGM
jgi:hypothetical protein